MAPHPEIRTHHHLAGHKLIINWDMNRLAVLLFDVHFKEGNPSALLKSGRLFLVWRLRT